MAHLIKMHNELHAMVNSTDVEGYRCETCDREIRPDMGYINADHSRSNIELIMCRDCVRNYE